MREHGPEPFHEVAERLACRVCGDADEMYASGGTQANGQLLREAADRTARTAPPAQVTVLTGNPAHRSLCARDAIVIAAFDRHRLSTIPGIAITRSTAS